MGKSVLPRARADLGFDQPVADGDGSEKDNRRDLLAGVSVRAEETPDGDHALAIVGLEGLDPQRYSSLEKCGQPAVQLDVGCFPIPRGRLGNDPGNDGGGVGADQRRGGGPWSRTHSGQ